MLSALDLAIIKINYNQKTLSEGVLLSETDTSDYIKLMRLQNSSLSGVA